MKADCIPLIVGTLAFVSCLISLELGLSVTIIGVLLSGPKFLIKFLRLYFPAKKYIPMAVT